MRQKTLRSLGLVVETNRSTWVIQPAASPQAAATTTDPLREVILRS